MKRKHIAWAILALGIGTANASESNGEVIDYWVHYDSDLFFFSVRNQTGRPACASFGSPSGRYVVNSSTDKGKAVISAVIAAKASGQKLRAWGANTCALYGDSEDLVVINAY